MWPLSPAPAPTALPTESSRTPGMEAFLVSAGIVFVAELGDKTQLVALSLASRYPLTPVLVGVGIAYVFTQGLSVIVGGLLGAALPTRAIGIGAGVLFLGFAVWTLRGEDEVVDEGDEGVGVRGRSVVASVATAMTLAEMGDKTMLTTATLAAKGDALATWLGATTGIFLSGAIAVVVGRVLGNRLPQRATRILAAVLFAAFGLYLLADNLF